MARMTIEMAEKKQISILQSLGSVRKAKARELGLSRNTVKSYLDVSETSESESNNDTRKDDLQNFFPLCQSELPRKGVTRQILWRGYRTKYPDGYSYSQFCEYLTQYFDPNDISLQIE
jgi:transposase